MATEAFTTVGTPSIGVSGARQFQGLFSVIPFKVNLEEDSVADQAGSNAVFSIAGAALGDIVLMGPAWDMTNMTFSASVISAGVVELQIHNLTGAAATGGATAGVWNGVILQPNANVFAQL